jgi:hypothetical protein
MSARFRECEIKEGCGRHYACICRRRIMTIGRAISGTVYTRLVTTTSIIAKLAVCAVLLAGIRCAHAASDDGVARRSSVPAMQNVSGARPWMTREPAASNLARLERGWTRQRSRHHLAMLHRFMTCSELGQCEGLALTVPGGGSPTDR